MEENERKPVSFETWLKDKYSDMFELVGDEEADTTSRLVRAVAMEAWQASQASAAIAPRYAMGDTASAVVRLLKTKKYPSVYSNVPCVELVQFSHELVRCMTIPDIAPVG